MNISRIYLDPTSDEAKFLTKFTVSQDKIDLYGSPPLMQFKSNLVLSMMDKIEKDNALASNLPLADKRSLEAVWLYINDKPFTFNQLLHEDADQEDRQTAIQLWPWLNYFDVPYENASIKQYIDRLVNNKNFLGELTKPENKEILEDVRKKIKIIDPELGEKFRKKFETDFRLWWGPMDYEVYSFDAKKSLDDQLKSNGFEITKVSYYPNEYNSFGNRLIWGTKDIEMGRTFVTRPALKYKGKYFMYPRIIDKEYHKYFMYPRTAADEYQSFLIS